MNKWRSWLHRMAHHHKKCPLNRYDKALIAAVAIGIIGILVIILPPLEDIGLGLGLFICAVFASRYILIKSYLEKWRGEE